MATNTPTPTTAPTITIEASDLHPGDVMVTTTRSGAERERTITAVAIIGGDAVEYRDGNNDGPAWTIPADWPIRIRPRTGHGARAADEEALRHGQFARFGWHTGENYPGWLRAIHAVNEAIPGTFGRPTSTGKWWAGGYVEHYPTARVIMPDPENGRSDDEGVLIVALTDEVAAALAALDLDAA